VETPVGTPDVPARTGRGRSAGSRATQFQPGHKGFKRRERRGPAGTPQLLLDMRAVYEQEADKDKSPGQRAIRALLEKSPVQFVTQLARLEEAALLAGGGDAQSAAPPDEPAVYRDEGLERSQEACRRWFAEAAERAREGSAPTGPADPGVAGSRVPLTPACPTTRPTAPGKG
jgi:hypothetical protein